ncbi:MAG: EAL domain-containing protein [Candidatus Dormibacteria bacterium]
MMNRDDQSHDPYFGLTTGPDEFVMRMSLVGGTMGSYTYVSPEVERHVGLTRAQVLDPDRRGLPGIHADDVAKAAAAFDECLASGVARVELRILNAVTGKFKWFEVTARTERHASAVPTALILVARDISHRRGGAEVMEQRGRSDPLTGLMSRIEFTDLASGVLNERTGRDPHFAVVVVDIDNLRVINDACGFDVGDRVIRSVAALLELEVGRDAAVARLGSDEFAVLLRDVELATALDAGRRIVAAVSSTVANLNGLDVGVSASAGVAAAHSGSSANELLRNADLAMYAARAAGGSCALMFEIGMAQRAAAVTTLTGDLKRAVRNREFVLHFQPIVELASGSVTGAEALVRWNHPTRGLVQPAEFIAMAEESGLIIEIGAWVMRAAMTQARAWADQGRVARMNINVSGVQLSDANFADQVEAALTDTRVDPDSITLELTETSLPRGDSALPILVALRSLGVRLALDDFGTGYSSLEWLSHFPIDHVKLPRTFVDGVGANAGGSVVGRAIAHMAQALRLEIVAEGIETQAQSVRLRDMGCRWAQGYLFSRPVSAAAFEKLPARLGPVGSATTDGAGRRALVVEDDYSLRRATARILRGAGFTVVEAGTGREALEVARRDRLDLAIVDVDLPDFSGLEVAKSFKTSATTADTPVIHVSGVAVEADDRIRGRGAGATAYLVKPVAAPVLLAAAHRLLGES